ncbi:hypothetical protein OROGR_029134 [Orobanche gracilis]
MVRFFNRVTPTEGGSSSTIDSPTNVQPDAASMEKDIEVDILCEASLKEVDFDNLPGDPGLRPEILSYPTNLIEQLARCFCIRGVNSWHKKDRLNQHVGDHRSEHSLCRLACENLMNQAQHIEVSLSKVSKQSRIDYRCRLNVSIICLRYLIMQGLAMRGHDESDESLDQGNFLELLKVVASCNDEIKQVVLNNAPGNLKLTSPDIQKDIVNAAAVETTIAIINDIGTGFFSILVDECRDVSVKEQMGVVIRYVSAHVML